MNNRLPVLFSACCLVASCAAAQTSDQNLPSAPSATVQQNAPVAKTQAPAETKPQPAAPAEAGSVTTQTPAPAPAPPAPPATATPGSSTPQLQNLENVDDTPVVRTTVNEVPVIFTVTDKHGRYVKGLKKDDFRVLDDHKPVEHVRSFRSETDLPLQVGLLIDTSNSIRDRFKFEQEAAIEFLNSIIRPRYDIAFVIGFFDTPEVTQDFTDNTELLSKGVRGLKAGGGTAMYDAIYYACRDKLLKREQSGTVRRALIVLSDGDDNLSHVTREESIEMAQRAEVIVYTISTNVTGSKTKYDKVLERIADATGGRAFFPFQIRDVSDAFSSIQDELRSQYAMSYKPADFIADGRFRTIEILAQQKAFRVRTRKGYFAPKP